MAVINDVYRISMIGAVLNEPLVNTFYYRISVVGTGDERDALNTAWRTLFNTTYPPLLAPDFVGVGVNIQAVKPVGTVKAYPAFPTAGTAATATLPTQVAVIITRKTNTPGRGGRGRLFMGAVPSGAVVGDTLTAAAQTAFLSFASNLTAGIANSGWSFIPVLWKRKTLTSLDLTATSLGIVVKTRRSRALGTRFHRRKRRTVGSI